MATRWDEMVNVDANSILPSNRQKEKDGDMGIEVAELKEEMRRERGEKGMRRREKQKKQI